MSIRTPSSFIYGHAVNTSNYAINFDEGSGELSAYIGVGSYSLTDFAVAIRAAMNSVGTFTYSVSVNRATRKLTISTTDGNFSLLAGTGSQISVGAWTLMGFAASNLTSAMSYTADAVSGSLYSPQFNLQDYIEVSDWKSASTVTVNKAANGRIEVIKFGDESFFQCNITNVTSIAQPSGVITNNSNGLSDLRTFMQYIINKRPIEFTPDVSQTDTFIKCILESSPGYNDGTGYKLKELYDKGLPGYYETGTLVFRVVE